MDFISGVMFGVGVMGFFFCLLFPIMVIPFNRQMQAINGRLDGLEKKKPRDEGDWWKDGISNEDEED